MFPHACIASYKGEIHDDCYLLKIVTETVASSYGPSTVTCGVVFFPSLAQVLPVQIEFVEILNPTELKDKLEEYADFSPRDSRTITIE